MKLTRDAFCDLRNEAQRALRRSKETPSVLICAGTGCIAGGAMKIYENLRAECESRNLPVYIGLKHDTDEEKSLHVKMSGCHGFCEMGPLVHIEPMGIYAGRVSSLEDLPDGAVIAVPNDATNEGRALLLLEAQGLITLDDSSNLTATPNNIVDNPKNLEFQELEAATIPSVLADVDLAVINSNYALGAGLNPTTDALAIESSDSPYVNVLVVKEGNENNEAIQALVDALHSDTIRDYITETFDGAVVPAF